MTNPNSIPRAVKTLMQNNNLLKGPAAWVFDKSSRARPMI